MSSLAQEESRSISENCTWGQRKRFADGKVTVPFHRFLGYDRGPNGELIVNPEEAETVKRIYRLFLQGLTYNGIAKQLTSDGIKTPGGKDTGASAPSSPSSETRSTRAMPCCRNPIRSTTSPRRRRSTRARFRSTTWKATMRRSSHRKPSTWSSAR
jgi:hypothetical protein